ncbi:translation initiation factor eif-2b subunit gamma [Phtheirospermum japonicum]|uniref:Translation initiation factor eIF2B subunit gamma n=1 Tax=Phtheirospermum japonicum TaxID=374723 RepID=A0A830CB39_9LAMI|nr:translation initiation factor eif-2b subunit gamma [Phtheirospermum japonicum]
MDFQVVVLAGGFSKTLDPLVSKRTQEMPKALLPVANRPVLSYVLELLEQNDLKNAIVVVEGENAALLISSWISSTLVLAATLGGHDCTPQYVDIAFKILDMLFIYFLSSEVTAVPEDVGTAGAIRAIDHRLTAKDILVVSGDLVSEIPPGAVAAAHRRHDAVVTAMLCSVPVSGPSDSGSSGTKDKAKKSGHYNIVGLDPTKQFLLHIASGAEVDKGIRVQKSILRAVGELEIRTDLMDAHMYAFKRSVLQDVLNQKETFHSLRRDVVPYLVRSQLRSELLSNGAQSDENGDAKDAFQDSKILLSQLLANASTPSFHEIYALGLAGSAPTSRKTHKCCVYIANKSKYCLVGDASHLSGYNFSPHNNIIHPSAALGFKTTVSYTSHALYPALKVGPQCMLGEGSEMGDKCSVKKSVIGRHCRIGSNVKIVNSVVMNYVTIGDGCSIQGSRLKTYYKARVNSPGPVDIPLALDNSIQPDEWTTLPSGFHLSCCAAARAIGASNFHSFGR